ncbi:MAG: outer membrane protein [Pirellulales bacterium]
MFKKTLFSIAALTVLAGSALAADLPHYKAPPPPPPPPPPLWTGFYVGLNAGGTWSQSNSIYTSSFPVASAGSTAINTTSAAYLASAMALGASGNISTGSNGGFIGGGQIGYNWQFYNSFVAGVEADIQGVASSRSNAAAANVLSLGGDPNAFFTNAVPDLLATTISSHKQLDYIGTVRGRLGYLVTPTLLVYGTGGLAYGGVSVSTSIFQGNNDCANFNATLPGCLTPAAFGVGNYSDTRVGWTAGAGLEWMFWPNWSTKVEYLYYDLGSVAFSSGVLASVFDNTAAGGTSLSAAIASQSRTRFDGHIVRVGVNYHFNWGAPAPVYAKY